MTTEPPSVQRRLRRRSDERVIAGVASGLGDYFNVDPLLIRILLVGSLAFAGLGIFLYVSAWLLVPDEASERSIAERRLGRAGLVGGLFGGLLILVAATVFVSVLGKIAASSNGQAVAALAILSMVIGAAVLLRRGR